MFPRICFRRPSACALLSAALILEAGFTVHGQNVIYQTSFGVPDFTPGNFAGQNGWSSGSSAAQIVSIDGVQRLQISGLLIASNSPNFYYCGYSRSLPNYSPVSAATPIVDVSASVWQEQGATTSQATQFTFLILNDQNGNAFGSIGIDQNGIVFGQNWNTPNQVVGDGSTATDTFHPIKMELNFTNKTIACFKDGFSIGTMNFNSAASNELGSITLVVERYAASPIESTLLVSNLTITASSLVSTSACLLQITGAGPWSSINADGAPGPPRVGNVYELYVTFNVRGMPASPFRIKWTMANVTYYFDNINPGPGTGYSWYFTWWLALDDPIPWNVTLDPDGVSGNSNPASAAASGSFTPVPPTNVVELYSPRRMHGWETSTLNFQPGSGTIGNLYVFFGVPTTHGAQQALSVVGPTNSQSVITSPYGLPLFEIARTNVAAGTFQDSNSFSVELNDMRVNPAILRTVTWADLASMPTNWTQWNAPDPTCESTNAQILAFVQQSLPANYQSVLTPYDTARALHRAVAAKLTYQSPPFHGDAVNVLQDGVADCGGFSALLTASLRAVGIPARTICGFWQGTGSSDVQWHVRVEFHLPGTEWVMADPTSCNSADPTGTYAYEFGYVPDANSFLAVDVGDSHFLLNGDWGGIQVPNWWWNGGATFNSYNAVSYLQPNGILLPANSSNGSFQFVLSDAPTAGSVVLQTSTDLTAWSPVATNVANGSAINYSFPRTNSPEQFYRAEILQ